MLKEGMYVRCPIDKESSVNPRKFAMGQIRTIDYFAEQVNVVFRDPYSYRLFYEDVPEAIITPISKVSHCKAFKNSNIKYNQQEYEILESEQKEGWYYYYIKNIRNKEILQIREDMLEISFINGHIQPDEQLKNYEFQNPCWYLGRNIVSKTMNVLTVLKNWLELRFF